jgi:hypothetical protein
VKQRIDTGISLEAENVGGNELAIGVAYSRSQWEVSRHDTGELVMTALDAVKTRKRNCTENVRASAH